MPHADVRYVKHDDPLADELGLVGRDHARRAWTVVTKAVKNQGKAVTKTVKNQGKAAKKQWKHKVTKAAKESRESSDKSNGSTKQCLYLFS